MDDLTLVMLRCLVMMLATAITTYLIPFLRTLIGEYKWKKLREFTESAVRFAEQAYTKEEWERKKMDVYHYVKNKAYDLGLELSDKDIDVLVEAFVNSVKHNKKKEDE